MVCDKSAAYIAICCGAKIEKIGSLVPVSYSEKSEEFLKICQNYLKISCSRKGNIP